MKFQLFSAIVLALLLTGCGYTIDAQYAKTSKGYINSGFVALGDVFLYDINESKITYLETVPITYREIKLADQVKSHGIKGVTIEGEVNKKIEADIKGEISQNAYVELENVFRRSPTRDGYMILIDEINSKNTIEKEQLVNAWRLDEANRKNSILRYIVITSSFLADNANFKYNDQKLIAGKFTPIKTFMGKMEVKVKGFSEQTMKGKKVPVLFKIQQFKASIRNGNYFFAIENIDSEKMANALRGKFGI